MFFEGLSSFTSALPIVTRRWTIDRSVQHRGLMETAAPVQPFKFTNGYEWRGGSVHLRTRLSADVKENFSWKDSSKYRPLT
jgi:hypothetical protein